MIVLKMLDYLYNNLLSTIEHLSHCVVNNCLCNSYSCVSLVALYVVYIHDIIYHYSSTVHIYYDT